MTGSKKKMRGVLVTWCPCHGTRVQEPSCGAGSCFAPLSTGLSCRLRARGLKHWLLIRTFPPFSSASWHPGASQTQPQCASSSGPFSSHSLKLDQSMTLPNHIPIIPSLSIEILSVLRGPASMKWPQFSCQQIQQSSCL